MRFHRLLATVVIIFLAAGISACAAGKTSIPTADEIRASGALPAGTDLDALRRGRAIMVTECTSCHRLFLPDEYSPEQWRGIAKRMSARASLSGGQAADLELYLSVASRIGTGK
jgi:hypothetical protein